MRAKKIFGIIVDSLMYVLILMQMAYVFVGNNIHEILGISFFVCLLMHIFIKRKWFAAVFKRNKNTPISRRVADMFIILLLISIVLMVLSSIGVSRLLFPDVHFMGEPAFHRLMATISFTLMVAHGGMHSYLRSRNKKRTAIILTILCIAAFSLGYFGVPYVNRHFRIVEINYSEAVSGPAVAGDHGDTLIVYFTRVGNTDFDQDVDAVAGASLMKADGGLMGNTQLMADMLENMLGSSKRAITLTADKYPSSYNDTVSVGGVELRKGLRPAIESINIHDYSKILLVYPIWWGTIPMPVATFLENNDFNGKSLYLFATQGSSGFGSSTRDIKALVPGAGVEEALSIYCDDIPKARASIYNWVNEHLGE